MLIYNHVAVASIDSSRGKTYKLLLITKGQKSQYFIIHIFDEKTDRA